MDDKQDLNDNAYSGYRTRQRGESDELLVRTGPGSACGEYQLLYIPAPDIQAQRGLWQLEFAIKDSAELMAR